MSRFKLYGFRWFSRLCVLVLLMTSGIGVSQALEADSPEQAQQYRYALGLIQRQLYDEAFKVLSRIQTDPSSFSQRDGVAFWMAECQYRAKKFTEAAGYYQQVLQDFPKSGFRDRAAYGLGWAHSKDNDPKSAVEAFAGVSKTDHGLWVDSRLKMGFLMVKYQMDPDATLALYEDLLHDKDLTHAQRYEALLQAGIGRFNQSLFEAAIAHFQAALPLAPEEKKASLLFYLSEALFRHKKFPEAIAEYHNLLNASPTTELAQKASYSMAWCHIKAGQPAEALPLFTSLAANPEAVVRKEAVRNLVDLLMNLHKYEEAVTWMAKAASILGGDEAVEMEYLRGLALSRLGEFNDSLKAFRAFLKAHPKHTRAEDARYQCALVLIAQGKFKDALEDLQPLIRREVTPAVREKALYRLGECYFNLGSLRNAREHFERVIKEYPSSSGRLDALYQLGEIAYQAGQNAEALEAFQTIGETGGDLGAQATFRRGEVLMKAGRHVDAVTAFEEYLTKFPQGALAEDAHFKIGLAQIELKDPAKALAAFSQLRDSKGYFRQEARFQIGEIARSVEDYATAIQQYKAIVTEEPQNPLASRARRAIGVSLLKLKDFPAAEQSFRAILKDFPSSDIAIPESRLWLGRTLIAQGKPEDGILEVLKVPVLYPKSPLIAEAYAEAARAYAGLGQATKARQMWKELLKLPSPPASLATEARAATKE